MAQQYQYAYAVIDLTDNMCISVMDSTVEYTGEEYIDIGTYNDEYLFKYYNRSNGKWYTDAAFTDEWIPE